MRTHALVRATIPSQTRYTQVTHAAEKTKESSQVNSEDAETPIHAGMPRNDSGHTSNLSAASKQLQDDLLDTPDMRGNPADGGFRPIDYV